ncbi:MAG: membrane protein insertase YidC [Candidatus Hydrogenedentes bacterium]|nr:membrane protein insertase YidC [Candidatus Hydrogenedentota bacterium]
MYEDDDEKKQKEDSRNQLIVFLTMGLMLIIWFQYFGPKPQPQTPPPVVTETITQPEQNTPAGFEVAEAPEPGQPAAEGATATTGWPNLPAIPAQTDPATDEVTLKKDDMELVFTRIGGRLKRASLLLGEHGDSLIQLVPESANPDTESIYPFGLRFSSDAIRDELDRRQFEVEKASDTEVVFSLTLPNAAKITKRFAFTDKAHVITATVEYTNLESAPRVLGRDQDPAYTFTWGPNITSGDLAKGVTQALVWRTGEETSVYSTASMKPEDVGKPYSRRFPVADWLGVRSAYFIVAMHPSAPSDGWAIGDHNEFRFGYMVPKAEIAPGQTASNSFDIYIGPSHLPQLKKAWATLDSSLQFFEYPDFLDWFAKLLLQMLNWFYKFIPNYGVAIVLLTVVVRAIMFPLTLKQMKTMKRMQMLAPEMEKIKEQYGNDPQVMQQKTMELYKEYGMNPLAGCLPMFLQLPIFIALYRMLWSAYELRGAPFALWIKDLSEPDKLLHIPQLAELPFFFHHLQYINVLPVLSALAMVASVKLTPMSTPITNPQQKMMMTIMPVFFSVFCYPLASGLNLYILTSTLLGIAQSYVLHFQEVEKPQKVQQNAKKKKHFYDAAIERKKQAERDLKEKKRKDKQRPAE